jgi:hypothetical protein
LTCYFLSRALNNGDIQKNDYEYMNFYYEKVVISV